MKFTFLFIILGILKSTNAQNDCLSPWEKIDDNICLLLNSHIKTWNHAKMSCNFYGGELLYINNEHENEKINEFIDTLLRYRFNLKPFAWLGALKKSEGWMWYHTNQSVVSKNWTESPGSSEYMNCGCFHLREKTWRPCDCNAKQHFICRKADRPKSEFIGTPKSKKTNLPLVMETPTLIEKDLKNSDNELSQDEKSIIVSSLVLMKEDDSEQTETRSQMLVQDDMKILENMRKNSGFMRDPNLFVNIYRTKVLKNSIIFTLYDCKYGFGYYAAGNDCTKYKICENWDHKYAILALNKCVNGKVFKPKEYLNLLNLIAVFLFVLSVFILNIDFYFWLDGKTFRN
ncbi:hypothetical protein BpHYR1_031428 [Brachionus plicatilis]|uniref:C-type lectin domain-containing protein n=1 Tax=Brachionus plicatilis TaxID=10195 RepID=A0A3M7RBD2_BRAPC|nr:hypothetical protein BpHYR1_031428 [Brachionus plicatilis]